MKIGIIGAGGIAHKMADTIAQVKNMEICAIASRSAERGKEFAQKYKIPRYYHGYEGLVHEPDLDLVYIATPHSCHYEQVKMCLEAGKNVLCEKAFMLNKQQADEVIELSEKRHLFLSEAMWTRFMPSRQLLHDILESGEIGTAVSLTANLGYAVDQKERMRRLELGGGALLDLGVYPINFALMNFGELYESVSSEAIITPEGVDRCDSITLKWKDGKMAVLHANMSASTDRRGIIYGEKGYIVVDNINNCQNITVYNLQRQKIGVYQAEEQITGYEYELEACKRAIENGQIECKEMPHTVTSEIMGLLDRIRGIWGMKFPGED